MRVALDTNRLTDLFQGDAELGERLDTCDQVFLPYVVIGEIQAGFYGGNQQTRNEALLRGLLNKPNVCVIYADRDSTYHYARLFVQLKRAGTPIPDNDIWIGALALQHDLVLITRDQHFTRIPQLLTA